MTKQELQEHYWLKRNIKKLEEKLLELETESRRVTVRYTTGSKGSSGDKLGGLVAKIVETQDQINQLAVQAYDKMMDIERAVICLPSKERYLIRLRYIECMSWYEIMEEMNYSWRQVHRIHSEALKELA